MVILLVWVSSTTTAKPMDYRRLQTNTTSTDDQAGHRGKWWRRTRRWFLRLRPSKHMGERGLVAFWVVTYVAIGICCLGLALRRRPQLPLVRPDWDRVDDYWYRTRRCVEAVGDRLADAKSRAATCCVVVTLCWLKQCCGHHELIRVYDESLNTVVEKEPVKENPPRQKKKKKKKTKRPSDWYPPVAHVGWTRRLPPDHHRTLPDLPPLSQSDAAFIGHRFPMYARVEPTIVKHRRALNEAALNGLPPPPILPYHHHHHHRRLRW